jgi:hypothetical protein
VLCYAQEIEEKGQLARQEYLRGNAIFLERLKVSCWSALYQHTQQQWGGGGARGGSSSNNTRKNKPPHAVCLHVAAIVQRSPVPDSSS